MRALRCLLSCAPLLLAACTDTARLELPDVPGAKSALLVLPGIRGDARAVALDLEQPDAAAGVALRPDTVLYALVYPWSLADLALAPGLITGDGGPTPRPLPPTEDAWVLDGASADRRWAPTRSSTTALAGFRIPGVARAACAGAGGCTRWAGGLAYCETPCTAPDWSTTIAPPAPPEPPRFTTCPEGWSRWTPRDVADGVTACAPPERVACAAGEVQWSGAAACARLGSECPSGQWPEGLAADVLRVAAPDVRCVATGTTYCSIADALAAAPEGATIVLAKGRYEEQLALTKGVTLRGACAAETILARPVRPSAWPLVTARGAVAIADLTITAAGQVALDVTSSAAVTLRDLHIDRAARAIDVAGTLDAEHLLVTNALGGPYVTGGSATLRQVVIEGARDWGVRGEVGSTVVIEDGVLDGALGAGGQKLALACSRPTGDSAHYSPYLGLGVVVEHGARLRVARTSLSGNYSDGLGATETPVELEDVVVRGNAQSGLQICGGTLSSVRATFVENGGVAVYGDFTELDVADTLLLDQVDAAFVLMVSGRSRVLRAYADRNHGFGMVADLYGATDALELQDFWVRRTAMHDDRDGNGMTVRRLGRLDFARVRLEDSAAIGLLLYANGPMAMEDVAILGTGSLGLTLQCHQQIFTPDCATRVGQATIHRLEVEGASRFAVHADAARLDLSDVVVRGTKLGAARDGHDGALRVASMNVGLPADLQATRFALVDNAGAGVSVGSLGTAHLHHGELTRNAAGVRVIPTDRDAANVEDDVAFRENGVDVEVTE